jgi:hypothetical protein
MVSDEAWSDSVTSVATPVYFAFEFCLIKNSLTFVLGAVGTCFQVTTCLLCRRHERSAYSTLCLSFIAASLEARSLCFKFGAEFTLSLWHFPGQKYRLCAYRCTLRTHKPKFIESCRSSDWPVYKTKVAIRGHRLTDFFACLHVKTRVYWACILLQELADVRKRKKKLLEPRTNISRTESMLRSEVLFDANTSDANGDVIVFRTSQTEFWSWKSFKFRTDISSPCF